MLTNNLENYCYICPDKTEIYFKSYNCNCKIFCHSECLQNIFNLEKCIICKKNITKDNNFDNKLKISFIKFIFF
mgnify:CR=1 FL=1